MTEATFSAPAGTTWTNVSVSDDGNPGKPVRERDLLNRQGRIAWLAFCSGPFLRRNGRQVFPPSDLWKELIAAPSGFPDRTTVFPDALGLPRDLDLHTREGQPILQYLVTSSTNALGWEFPLQFRLIQYCPVYLRSEERFATNGWQVQFTATGSVTSIRTTQVPHLPDQRPTLSEKPNKE